MSNFTSEDGTEFWLEKENNVLIGGSGDDSVLIPISALGEFFEYMVAKAHHEAEAKLATPRPDTISDHISKLHWKLRAYPWFTSVEAKHIDTVQQYYLVTINKGISLLKLANIPASWYGYRVETQIMRVQK